MSNGETEPAAEVEAEVEAEPESLSGRGPFAYAGDVENGGKPGPPDEPGIDPPALEGKLVEVRYSGPIDEVEVDLPNGTRARVKSGSYLKTTADHADGLTAGGESEVWKVKGGGK